MVLFFVTTLLFLYKRTKKKEKNSLESVMQDTTTRNTTNFLTFKFKNKKPNHTGPQIRQMLIFDGRQEV